MNQQNPRAMNVIRRKRRSALHFFLRITYYASLALAGRHVYSIILGLTNKPTPKKNSLSNIADETDITMYEGNIFVYQHQAY